MMLPAVVGEAGAEEDEGKLCYRRLRKLNTIVADCPGGFVFWIFIVVVVAF